MTFRPGPNDDLWDEYEAKCETPGCGWTKKFKAHASTGLKIGDILGRSEDPNSNRCVKCKATQLKVTKVPQQETAVQSTGFWKIPKE